MAERESVRDVYEAIPIAGRCVDIAGHQGRLRAYLSSDQEYISKDPSLDIFSGLEFQNRLLEAFPVLTDPLNFISAFFEHLPF